MNLYIICDVPLGNGSFLREKTMVAAMRVNIIARVKAKWNESTDLVIWMMMFTNPNTNIPDMTTTIPKIGRKKEVVRVNVFVEFLRESDRILGVQTTLSEGAPTKENGLLVYERLRVPAP